MKRQLFFVCPFSCLFSGFLCTFAEFFMPATLPWHIHYYIMTRSKVIYHVMALLTAMVWAVTFVSSKILLSFGIQPSEIFFLRFLLAYIAIIPFAPKRLWCKNVKHEMLMALLGITGGSAYFLFENTALLFTSAGNVCLFGFLHSFAHCFALHMDGTRRETHPPPRTRFHSCLCGRGSCGHKRLDTRATEICRRHSRSSCCSHVGFLPTSHKACLCSLFGNIHNAKSICLRTAFYNYILPLLPSHNFLWEFSPTPQSL